MMIENGTVVITNGKISAVGANVPIPAGAQRIDATGKIVTPGFVDASTQLGVQEVKWGLFPMGGSSVRLPAKLRPGRHVFAVRAVAGDVVDGSDAFLAVEIAP